MAEKGPPRIVLMIYAGDVKQKEKKKMKKFIAMTLALVMMLAMFAGCSAKEEATTAATEATTAATEATTAATEATEAEVDIHAKGEGVMTYADYAAAELDSEVVIEAFVQGKQSWWEDKATVYLQDKDGAYFVYEMACSEDDYAKIPTGTKIKVAGYKAEWAGEVEIVDATFEILEGEYIAEATDVTALLGKDELVEKQNMFVSFKGMTVEASEGDAPFLYKWDGSGQEGDDIYFNVSLDGTTYTFTVESYLTDSTTDVYKAAQGLNVGDVIDMEGFLYWYEGVNPHITAITVK